MKNVTTVTETKPRIRRNRQNGKKYEGELVRTLKEMGIAARLGRSNEEGDVILPEINLVLEAKSTHLKDRYRLSKASDQYFRLKRLKQTVFYAVRFKGEGISGWEFYPIPPNIQVLYRHEGLSLKEFVLKITSETGQNREATKSNGKIPITNVGIEPIALRTQKRR